MARKKTVESNLKNLVSALISSGGMGTEEIANILNISAKSVPPYLSKARKNFGLEIKKDRSEGLFKVLNRFVVPSPAQPITDFK